MKNPLTGLFALLVIAVFTGSSHTKATLPNDCQYHKDSMRVVMRFEIKVMPEHVSFLKQSFDACKEEVLAREPGCLDYSLFQSYHDSTLFCITETWASKGDHNAHMKLGHTRKHIAETRDIRDPGFQSTTNYVYWICPGANDIP